MIDSSLSELSRRFGQWWIDHEFWLRCMYLGFEILDDTHLIRRILEKKNYRFTVDIKINNYAALQSSSRKSSTS